MIKFNEDEKLYKEDNPYSNNPNGSIALPLVRKSFPQLFSSQTVGVIPTNEPQRTII